MRRSRQKTLAAAVYGSLKNPEGKLTSMARGMGGGVQLRDRLKQLSRFVGNASVHIEETGAELLSWLCGRQGPLIPIVVLMDWTEEHQRHVLLLSLKWGKRSIPFYWYSVEEGKLARSRNTIEATAVKMLRSWVPKGHKIILIADRGFARSRLFKTLRLLNIDFIIRIPKSTHILSKHHHGALETLRVSPSIVRDLSIEATFKDLKTTLGWRFQTLISKAERLSRYLLILVLTMICALITAERKSTQAIHRWVTLQKAFRGTEPVSFVQLGLWLIQNIASQLTLIHPRKPPAYAL